MTHTGDRVSGSAHTVAPALNVTDKDGHPIHTLEDWYALAPPSGSFGRVTSQRGLSRILQFTLRFEF